MVARDDGKVLAIEVKLASTVDDRDLTHLRWLGGNLGAVLLDAVVINTGLNAYRRPDGSLTRAIPGPLESPPVTSIHLVDSAGGGFGAPAEVTSARVASINAENGRRTDDT